MFQNSPFYTASAGNMSGFLSSIFWKLGWAPENKSHSELLWFHLKWVYWELLVLRVVLTEPSAICQLQLRFSYLALFSTVVSALVNCDSPDLSVSQIWGLQCALDLPFSNGSKKSCWFFSLFSFLPIVQIDWKLPSFLYAELETRRILNIYFNVFWPFAFLLLQIVIYE